MTLDNLHFKTDYLSLDSEFYDMTDPIPLDDPYLISFNPHAAKLIGLENESRSDPRFIELLNGTFIPESARPFSMCYAGHQFGHYASRLGDGRAITLGSINGWHLQTKGSGETLYARMSDGRAAIPSSIREYLMSEAMHHLGIPTTRALGVIGSETNIVRNTIEKAAIVMRMSPSWVRFGTFEYFYYTKEHEKLKSLTEYVITESYPQLKDNKDRYYLFFSEVVERTAKLIAQWQSMGFCHGVMNTDNMSILGLTIDYGPYGWLEGFDFGWTPNTTDRQNKRYRFGNQPNIGLWNLLQLANALYPLVNEAEPFEKILDTYQVGFQNDYLSVMSAKFGLNETHENLVDQWDEVMQITEVDMTIFFRLLSNYKMGEPMNGISIIKDAFYNLDQLNDDAIGHWNNWFLEYDKRLQLESLTKIDASLLSVIVGI